MSKLAVTWMMMMEGSFLVEGRRFDLTLHVRAISSVGKPPTRDVMWVLLFASRRIKSNAPNVEMPLAPPGAAGIGGFFAQE